MSDLDTGHDRLFARGLRRCTRQAGTGVALCGLTCIALTIGPGRPTFDVLPTIGLILSLPTMLFRSLHLLSICLVILSLPPWEAPTFWGCIVPAAWCWTRSVSPKSAFVAGFAYGFVACWSVSAFVREAVPERGWLLQAAGCVLHGLQWGGIAVVFQVTQKRHGWRTLLVRVLSLTLAELLQLQYGVTWPLMSISAAAADTTVAQWASVAGPLGVAGGVYAANCLCLLALSSRGIRRRHGLVLALAWVAAIWSSGTALRDAMQIESPPLSVLLVQPGDLQESTSLCDTPVCQLERLTGLHSVEGSPVDLIVWPETCLPLASVDELGDIRQEQHRSKGLTDVRRRFSMTLQSSGLVGVPIRRPRLVRRHGVSIQESEIVNTAVLIQPDGGVQVHEKQVVVPIREGLPSWCDNRWVRRVVLPLFDQSAQVTQGSSFRLLRLQTRDGRQVRIAVCICYESLFPQLPQFRMSSECDAIVHLIYDGDFQSHPEWIQIHLTACRQRAIETRKWTYVCSTVSGSAVIDPSGRMIARLEKGPGALRFDRTARPRSE
ncbi:apolipoprotein N-acyltransferase [Maioricimonas sp. JC845]|uniref:apolipoprotein N-acyltransferase n=1 Tax=Maioricimonas sp. JC845 TaxID=3232138 RepID=UPI0034592B2A